MLSASLSPYLGVVVLGLVAVGIAALLRVRERPAPEASRSWAVPSHVARDDFARPDAPWLVVVFSSATCLACRETWEQASALASGSVAVQEVEAVERRDLHERYGVDAVPLLLVVDEAGIVRRHVVGPPAPGELADALAELRDERSGGAEGADR